VNFTTEDIHRYQELCRRYFNEDVEEQRAIEELSNLIFMVELIYHPLSNEHLQQLKELAKPKSTN